MKVHVLRSLVENQTLAALKEAVVALIKDQPLAFEVEGDSLSEKLNNIIAAINILEQMNAVHIEFEKALQDYSKKIKEPNLH
jgi:hypothetical protein